MTEAQKLLEWSLLAAAAEDKQRVVEWRGRVRVAR